MERTAASTLRVGDWCVNPSSGEISRNGETSRVEVRTMRLLVYLAERAGEVVSIDELISHVWSGVSVAPDSVYQAVTSLRRVLGDDSKQPSYIETVPRLGYRMVAAVSRGPASSTAATGTPGSPRGEFVNPAIEGSATTGWRARTWVAFAVGLVLILTLAAAFGLRSRASKKDPSVSLAGVGVGDAAGRAPKSIAVLPFLDLTEKMNEEPFADGMTEELIDRLSKVSGLQVPSPTSSFYFKHKKLPVADIAKALGVAYVLDGSVRKSGNRFRVAARLIRAESGYIVWSETYDRSMDDILMVQDDIAGQVTKALTASIEARPSQDESR